MLKTISPKDFTRDRPVTLLIYGKPGSWKTSLGFCTKNPFFLDLDDGAHRSVARKEHLSADVWKDIEVISAEQVADHDVIVVDTVGRLLDMMSSFLMIDDPKNADTNGSLSLPGWGALKWGFINWVNRLRALNKHIVFLAHTRKENERWAPDIQGASSGEVFKLCDAIGYLFGTDTTRKISFVESDLLRNDSAKDPAGLGIVDVPELTGRDGKLFLAKLIGNIRDGMGKIKQRQIALEKTLAEINAMITRASDAESMTACLAEINMMANEANKKQAKRVLATRLKALNNVEFDTKEKKFYDVEEMVI